MIATCKLEETAATHWRVRSECIMDTFSPEFNAYWRADDEPEKRSVAALPVDAVLSASQQVALEELVERVAAARSIV